MMPPEPQSPQNGGGAAPLPTTRIAAAPPAQTEYSWYHKMWAFIFITFCLEIGLFLLIFPWTDYWGSNYFSNLLPPLESWWDNMYLRGAVSGLGVANLYISFVEIFRLKRFARH
jgi:hypothetical protein